ncbi:hypothetical protein B0T19DRAFT_445666 [Cercophora scortea]|uniref:Uncharacterized protein n=1 Tax=Cercophora scortea TaxID=314031 RepID=A0AAE0M615_9PEZI|nr:hypothetical protein B0T19DRAFT_445666 [Cercophora scortea]
MDRYAEYKLVPDPRNDDDEDEFPPELESGSQPDKALGQDGRFSVYELQWQGVRATRWFQIGFLVVAAIFVALSMGACCLFLGKHVQKRHMENDFIGGGGFFQNPDVSPKPYVFSAYHQLHCVSSIWRAYWAAVQGTEPEHDAGVGHVRHCIDYLRQSLMCLADTNQEPMDEKLKASTGFGVTRMCRSYDRSTAFADEWRISDD